MIEFPKDMIDEFNESLEAEAQTWEKAHLAEFKKPDHAETSSLLSTHLPAFGPSPGVEG